MWNFLTGSERVEDSVKKIRNNRLKENLKNAKPSVQTKRPQSHRVSNNSRKKQLKEDRDLQIFKENQILMRKMMTIDLKPSAFKANRVSSARITGRSASRTQQNFKIFQENQRFLRRLQSTSSHYSITRFEQDNRYHEYLKSNIRKKPSKTTEKREKSNTANDLISQILKRRDQRKNNCS